jgi:hypothetical protein
MIFAPRGFAVVGTQLGCAACSSKGHMLPMHKRYPRKFGFSTVELKPCPLSDSAGLKKD